MKILIAVLTVFLAQSASAACTAGDARLSSDLSANFPAFKNRHAIEVCGQDGKFRYPTGLEFHALLSSFKGEAEMEKKIGKSVESSFEDALLLVRAAGHGDVVIDSADKDFLNKLTARYRSQNSIPAAAGDAESTGTDGP